MLSLSYSRLKTVAQHGTLAGTTRGHHSRLLRSWATEIVSSTLGICLIVVLGLILKYFDGKPPPQFGTSVLTNLSLNTLVAIITTAVKAFLTGPFLECVSQQKWIWFSKQHRKLSDISAFDKASRGVFGGLSLLRVTRIQSLATLTPLLMLFAFTLDPFSQQLITYVPKNTPAPTGHNATIGIATSWSVNMSETLFGTADPNPNGPILYPEALPASLQRYISNGILYDGTTIQDLVPSCPRENCTFENYESLAVCYRLQDVSHKLSIANCPIDGVDIDMDCFCLPGLACSASNHPGTAFIQMLPAVPSTFDPSPLMTDYYLKFSSTIAFANNSFPITDVFIVLQTAFQPVEYVAYELMLDWCIQQYSTSDTGGQIVTRRLGSEGNFSPEKPFSLDMVLKTSGANETMFRVHAGSHQILQRYFFAYFNGSGTAFGPGAGQEWALTSSDMQGLVSAWNITNSSSGSLSVDPTGFEKFLNNVATSLTNYVRSEFNPKSKVLEGVAYAETTVIVVRWKWISGLAVFACLVLCFLVDTIVKQRQGPLKNDTAWKSLSPAVLHALDPAIHKDLSGITSETRLQEQDTHVSVKLHYQEDDGWRLRTQAGIDEGQSTMEGSSTRRRQVWDTLTRSSMSS